MVFCPKCSAEYTVTFDVCSDCGVDLITDTPLDIPEGCDDGDWIELHTFPEYLYANMAVELLMREGIPAYSISNRGSAASAGRGDYLSSNSQVYVLEPEFDEAMSIIKLIIEELPGSSEGDYDYYDEE
ncbi:MAG: hypothetical protein HN590_13450 [Calditrichaeota bacterium]|nr:hypothetical protein [Calditrichota bacterium]